MDVTVVVPLSGGPDQALRCLEALAAQPEQPAFEVVVVDDAAVGLEHLLRRLEGDIAVVRQERRCGTAAALRAALPHATGEHLVLLTGAAQPAPGAFAALVAPLADPVVALTAAGAGPAVGALAVAVRRAQLAAVPDAPDELAVAALCAAQARLGAVVAVPEAVVAAPGGRSAAARGLLGAQPELTVVIPTLDAAGDRARRCIAAIQRHTDVPHEIVIVDNGAPPQGFTAPVNAGLRAARGAFMVVCNDDVEVLPGWWPPLRAALEAGHPVAFPLTIDGAMRRDFAAWCFALSRETLETFGVEPGEFLDPRLVVWFQDTDLLDRLRAAGRPPVLADGSRIRHGLSETVATPDPALRAWIDQRIAADKAVYDERRGVAQAAR